ncbi:hypothetical protein XENOCAPTIV_017122 [Xenoophorus captivus]|uniref:Immunoglobulin domain-containing protein n=1 Tax=Xenoophorus captivus TaxID=1517983 RepID=A0ABV0S7F0_9TELE
MFQGQKMLIFFICFSCNTLLISGASQSDKVRQYPAEIYGSPDSEAKINCSHNDNTFNRILWYKQSAKDLQLLGYMYAGAGKLEEGVNMAIKGGANKDETCTLTIEGLNLNSSAVYFCAASLHSVSNGCFSIQKPLDLTVVFVLTLCYSSHPPAPAFLPILVFLSDLIREFRMGGSYCRAIVLTFHLPH